MRVGGDRTRRRGGLVALAVGLLAVLALGTSIAAMRRAEPRESAPLAVAEPSEEFPPPPRPPPMLIEAPPPPPPPGSSEAIFAEEFPAQAAAVQRDDDPASFHWAVLVGINAYQGRTRDNIGSRQDAVLLRDLLLRQGWREDHILLLDDRDATRARIMRGLEWLARSTDERSTAIFSFSGHAKVRPGDPDGDGEKLDEGLWAADNAFVWDADLGRLLSPVRARRMWVSIQACEAAGFNDTGVEGPGRVMTYSSKEDEGSYEDPEVGFSVQGNYMFAEGLRDGFGDADEDGRISIQDAYAWAAPRAHLRTAGRQSPILVDRLGAPFRLEVTGAILAP